MLMVLSSERYEKMVSEAAVEYAQAAAAARAENVRVVEQRAELDKLMAEQAALMRQVADFEAGKIHLCLLYTSPSPRDGLLSRMPSSA